MAGHRLYTMNDFQLVITFINRNPAAYNAYCEAVKAYFSKSRDICNDRGALFYVVESGSAESFMRFDSAVADGFIAITEELFGKNWHEKGIKF